MLAAEHAFRVAAELPGHPLMSDRETAHPHAVHVLDALGKFVPPGDVVARARGDHLDVGMPGEAFRNIAGVQLRAAVDVRAVALNRDRELHESEEVSAGSESEPTPGSDRGAPASPFDGASSAA